MLLRGHNIAFILLVVVSFTIAGCKIDGAIKASPDSIERGQSSMLTWGLGEYSGKAESALIEPGIGDVPVEGSIKVSPMETTTYLITWRGTEGETASDEIIVNVYPPPSVNFDSDKKIIQNGESAVLSWATENGVSCSIDNGIGDVGINGSVSVSPSHTTVYTISVLGQYSTDPVKAEVSISVYKPPTVIFNADRTIITKGEQVELSWVSENAFSCSISPGIGDVPLSGAVTTTPQLTTKYKIIVSDSADVNNALNCANSQILNH